MAKKVIYICDVCEKEKPDVRTVSWDMEDLRGKIQEVRSMDFCNDCIAKVLSMIFQVASHEQINELIKGIQKEVKKEEKENAV